MHIDTKQLGKYELREHLGQGGMAEVWKAFDTRLQRFVAIKFLHSTLRNDPTFISSFLREGQAVASLHHPNIIQIYDFEAPAPGEEEAPAYMVMDYIEGQTLSEFLYSTAHVGKFLQGTDLLSLFYSISSAIDYAHRRGLLHRDIKPTNILLDQRNTACNPMGEPILTDFGIAKIMGTSASTLTSFSMGTPLYISPEQAYGHPATVASDIYSLGLVLYETCTGRPPFWGDSPYAIFQQHMTAEPPPPETFNPALSSELSAVILRSLAKRPEDRYPSAMALITSMAIALGLALPDRRDLPIPSSNSHTLSSFPETVEDVPAEVPGRQPAAPVLPVTGSRSPFPFMPDPGIPFLPVSNPGTPLSPVPGPASFVSGVVRAAPAEVLLTQLPQTPVQEPKEPHLAPSTSTPASPSHQPEPPGRSTNRRRGLLIVLSVLLIAALVISSLTAFQMLHAARTSQAAAPTSMGRVFFLSTGAGDGAQNLGINDEFQVNLSNIPAPATGKQYYAWLLPDAAQPEASDRLLGTLRPSGGTATLSYVDPQHANLIGTLSRFLVTEEPANPVPISHSLDKTTWRYYAEMPQGTLLQDCTGVQMDQLSVLCHLRHLLSGDPDLAKVHLQGGLSFWLQHNVGEMVKWAQQAVDLRGAVDVRHKLVNMLYVLKGPSCIQQSMQKAAPGADNGVDDAALPTVAAIPLLDCSLTANLPGYVTHIDNHLNAMLSSPGITNNQMVLAKQVSLEFNTIVSWMKEVQSDAEQLVAMNNVQLTQPAAQNLRSAMKTLAVQVLSGGTDTATGAQDPGIQAIILDLQDLAKLNVTVYQGQ